MNATNVRLKAVSPSLLVEEGLDFHPTVLKPYRSIIGKTVQEVVIQMTTEGDPSPAILFTDGTLVFLTSDPEGNGAGWLELWESK